MALVSPAPGLLDLPDDNFIAVWAEMSIEERGALPADLRAMGFSRYTKLRPDLSSAGERALRSISTREEQHRPPPTEAPLPGFMARTIWEGHTPGNYLVKDILEPGAVTVLFGQSGHFKSVASIGLSLAVGTGHTFHGIRVHRGGVLYVAGEGHGGMRKRMRAWLLEHGYDSTSEQPSVFITSASADLIGNPDQLRATVDYAAKQLGMPIDLVVIDTLAANFGNGDEQHTRDMQLAIAGARRAAPAAALLIVHHTGHGNTERERGSSSLICAADFRLLAAYDVISKTLEVKWLKVKDGETPEPLIFSWHKVMLDWLDVDGEELSSVVLRRLAGPAPPREPQSVGMGKNEETALKVLRALYIQVRQNLVERGDDPTKACVLIEGWRHACEARMAKGDKEKFRYAWRDIRNSLPARRLVHFDGPHVYLTEAAP